ncbi:MAG: GAF domain-containing protein [Spirochaetes bacterium]|nr:MAG: GAF domain-containing protein [Spirochaetota bacterium]
MSFLAITGLVNFLTSAVLGLFVLSHNPRNAQNRSFAYANGSIALYSLGYFLWQIAPDAGTAHSWFKVLFTGIVFVNVTFLHLVYSFTGNYRTRRRELHAYYAVNLIFCALNLASQLYDSVEPRFGLGFWPTPLPLFHAYLAFWFWQCVYGSYWLIRSVRTLHGVRREQVRYTLVSAIVGFLGGCSNWPMWYGYDIPPYANILVSVYVIIIAYAIIRYRLLDVRIVLTRAGIFLLVYAPVLGIPLWIGLHGGFGISAFLSLFALTLAGPFIQRYIQGKAEGVLMAKQRSYQHILLNAAKSIVREHDLDKLLKLIAYGVKRAVKAEFTAIFLRARTEDCYRLRAHANREFLSGIAPFSRDDPLVAELVDKMKPLVFEEVNHFLAHRFPREVHLVVPTFWEGDLLGFMLIGKKLNKSYYTRDDVRTFEILSHQAALAVENCLYVEDIKTVQERLFQAEKLAFIGGMAEGVAHQIKNRLNHFSLATREMQLEIAELTETKRELMKREPELEAALEYLKELGDSLIDNVKRTDAVIQGILSFASMGKDADQFSSVTFDELLRTAADLVRIKHDVADLPLAVESAPYATLFGIRMQLVEVLYDLIDNSYESIVQKKGFRMGEEERRSFEPRISVRLVQETGTSLVEIADNGTGMRAEDRKKVFAPYFTTKSSYKIKTESGIGLYVARRIIEETHRGQIWFESEYGKGTRFFIRIPRPASLMEE